MAKKNEVVTISKGSIANISNLGLSDEILSFNPIEDLGKEFMPVPYFSYNVKAKIDGKTIPKNVFYNTLTQEIRPSIETVILDVKKQFREAVFNADKQKTEIKCNSFDCVKGNDRQTGEVINCNTCKKRAFINGKAPKCSAILNFICLDENDEIFIVRAKSTSYQPAKQFITSNFYKAIKKDGKFYNAPFFSVKTGLWLILSDGTEVSNDDNWGILQFHIMKVNSKAEIEKYGEIYKAQKQNEKLNEALKEDIDSPEVSF